MTPLASWVIEDRRASSRARKMHGGIATIKKLKTASFFDATMVFNSACELQDRAIYSGLPRNLMFLPAPTTFIEWSIGLHGGRVGVMLNQDTVHSDVINVIVFCATGPGKYKFGIPFDFYPNDFVDALGPQNHEGIFMRNAISNSTLRLTPVPALLAMINSPKIISRKTHLPQPAMQKQLANKKNLVGKYPLQAWTELLLEVTLPKDESNLPECETVLTGERALHFVRAHLRIVRGKLVRVSAHFRGNAALGIKRTRYSVVPPKNGVWPKFIGTTA